MSMRDGDWKIFRGSADRTDDGTRKEWLEAVPPWRRLSRPSTLVDRTVPADEAAERRGRTYISSGPDEILRVNAALMLRRPLLVTGAPGIGKSSLAYSIAWCLDLGVPLRWEINSRTTLQDGLYTYDAVGHLQASQSGSPDVTIGEFITLGPLGTALLPTDRPRVLLIDEIDKAAFDLPNDLLHVFEEGSFTIPELVRLGGDQQVFPYDSSSREDRVTVSKGRVSTLHHPVIVITSNAERAFSDAFLRRCVRLELGQPDADRLQTIVVTQLEDDLPREVVTSAIDRLGNQTTDVLIQAVFLEHEFRLPADDVARVLRRGQ
jgi:MoxR-like ATPase